MAESITYIEGMKDKIRRRVCEVPKNHPDECKHGYTPVLLELAPGQWVRQIVDYGRIETVREKR